MSASRLRRLLVAATFALLLTAAPAEAATCDRYASPFGNDYNPGTELQPYATAQRLADVLTPGQTGCLLAGVYDDEIAGPFVLRFGRGGLPGAPITIRNAPGQDATLRGIVYVPNGSDHVTLADVDIDARRPTPDTTAGIQILGKHTIIEDSTITNRRTANCMILGVPGWGQAVGTIVRRNVFRDCGGTETIREHAVYVEYTQDVLITDNLFDSTGAYAVHLYPEARGTTVTHNVMVNGGGGVIFAGEAGGWSSKDSVVSQNIVTGTWNRPGIHSWWGGPLGTNNIARDNCLFDNPLTNVDVSGGGFTATGNVIANPQYRNPGARDYRLSATSPCLAKVGYDTVAKIMGEPAIPAPTPTPVPTTTPAPTASPSPTATRTPAPTATPARTATPAATATPTATAVRTPVPTPSPDPTPQLPVATPAAPPTVQSPPATQEPGVPAEEAAVFVDSAAFTFSGGSRRGR